MTHGPTVLIGFAQAFAAVEAAWSLQRSGMRVIAFSRRGSRTALRHVPGIRIHEITPPEESAAGAAADIERLLRADRPEALLPLDDISLWLTAHADLCGTALAGPDADGVRFALDKSLQLAAAGVAGFAVPETRVLANADEVTDFPQPVVAKPANAVERVGDRLVRPHGAICADATEFVAARRHLGTGPLLIQPYLRGTGEGVFGYVDDAGVATLSAHRRVRMVNPHGSASSACESIAVPADLRAAVERFIADSGWRGLFMVEMLRDARGEAWFMELNGRAWGSLALSRRRGLEYPAWAVQAALGSDASPPPPPHPRHVVARHLGRELAHLLFVFRGPQSRAVSGWPGRARTIVDLARISRSDRLYNWNPRQPLVLATDTLATLTDLVAGRPRKG